MIWMVIVHPIKVHSWCAYSETPEGAMQLCEKRLGDLEWISNERAAFYRADVHTQDIQSVTVQGLALDIWLHPEIAFDGRHE